MLACERRASPGECGPPHELAMPVLLRRLAHELCYLQLMAAGMESAVAGMIERHAGMLDAQGIQNLQLLDILNQSLQALATFADSAAALASPGWTLDGTAATAELKLAGLAQRLAAGAARAGEASADAYELFSDQRADAGQIQPPSTT